MSETQAPTGARILPTFTDAFEAWSAAVRQAGQVDSASSARSYSALWQPFARWCIAQSPPVTLDSIDAEVLQRYVRGRDGRAAHRRLSDRHVWRVLQLVDRVLITRAHSLGQPANRSAAELLQAIPEWRHANAAHRNPLPQCLTSTEAARLVILLTQTEAPLSAAADRATWQALRNRAAVALHLGAGLTPHEVRALTLDSAVTAGGRVAGQPWKLAIAATDNRAAREVPVAAWASRCLARWLNQRAQLGIPGAALLPSTLSGKPWGKVAHYNAVRRVLTDAELHDAAPAGAYQLRHTYVLRQLKRGHTELQVSRWLGVEIEELARYRHVVHSTVIDIV